jgi:hypothetical protein
MSRLPTEHEEQAAVIRWAADHRQSIPDLALLVHVPNGEYRDMNTAKRLAAAGVRAGYPDLLLDAPRGPYHGLRIELKRRKGGTVSVEQAAWLSALQERGYAAVVAHGAHEAVAAISAYLALPIPPLDVPRFVPPSQPDLF